MRFYRSSVKFFLAALIALSLSACLTDDSDDPAAGFHIEFTNPAGATKIQTPDIVVNISGKITGSSEIKSVTWVNDRGGKGNATGKEQWATGNIVLQLGTNTITITATDVLGGTVSKELVVERENTTAPGNGASNADTIAMYSYSSDLSNAAPVKGATISAKLVYFFLKPAKAWRDRGISKIKYDCCYGISGAGSGTPHNPTVTTTVESWKISVDLSGYQLGGTRRLAAYAIYTDGVESNRPYFDFVIGGGQALSNRAPTISGTPARTATVGNQYNFRPVGQDADGDTMRFTIKNKPVWASFSETTGRLYGTPTVNHVGAYDAITISVSDGKSSSSLPQFSIEVESFGNSVTTLQWSAPTQRTDNTALTNLAGFNLYYGQTSGDYGNKVAIKNSGVSTYVVDNLSSGKWFFIITAFDTDGIESNPSNEVARSF